jgi:hypothetical protein
MTRSILHRALTIILGAAIVALAIFVGKVMGQPAENRRTVVMGEVEEGMRPILAALKAAMRAELTEARLPTDLDIGLSVTARRQTTSTQTLVEIEWDIRTVKGERLGVIVMHKVFDPLPGPEDGIWAEAAKAAFAGVRRLLEGIET